MEILHSEENTGLHCSTDMVYEGLLGGSKDQEGDPYSEIHGRGTDQCNTSTF